MPKITYVHKQFKQPSLDIIDSANKIIDKFHAKGFDLTLRQLYYQFVAGALIENSEKSYNRIGAIISEGRKAGLIDWNRITDRTRFLRKNSHWVNPAHIINSALQGFRIDKWETQAIRTEVWIEKDALIGVISMICENIDVPYFSCRGYTSDSELWRAGMRAANVAEGGQVTHIIHLGDHDPSGIDMTRDIEERIRLFSGLPVIVARLALNLDQIEQYDPPPNPAKMTDPRFKDYMAKYGEFNWELDALNPEVIQSLIEDAVAEVRDEALWEEMVKKEEKYKEELLAASSNWSKVRIFLSNLEEGKE